MKYSVGLVMIAVLLLTAADGFGSESPFTDVAKHVQQLGADVYTDRQAAEVALVELTEQALRDMPDAGVMLNATDDQASAAITAARKQVEQAKVGLLKPLAEAAAGDDAERAERAKAIHDRFAHTFANRVAMLEAVRSGKVDLTGLTNAESLLIGTIVGVRAGPTMKSMPPIYTGTVVLNIESVLRGAPLAGKQVEFMYRLRQPKPPVYAAGKRYLVSATKHHGSRIFGVCKLLTPDLHASAIVAAQLPVGWQLKDGKCISPWAQLGDKAWADHLKMPATSLRCATTDRPALRIGTGVKLAVEKVPPPKDIKWRNPDGDGQYTITVTNTTDREVTVPALLHDGKQILWAESLFVDCQGVRLLRSAKGLADFKNVMPTKLAPRQKVTTVVQALALPGDIRWPRGGSRINFQFCLGEQVVTQSFYYYSSHHDKIRNEAVKALEGK